MERSQKRCLVTSLAAHATLVLAVLLLPGFMRRKAPDPEMLPPMELVDTSGMRLSVNQSTGGGTSPPPPEQPAPEPARQPPPEPARQPPPEPARQPPPEPVRQPVPEPVRQPPRPEPVRVNADVVRVQDKDERRPAPPKPAITISRDLKRADPKDLKAEQERRREQARAEAERRAAAEAARRQAAVSGLRSQLAERLSGETDVKVPGPGGGGAAWLNYADYLRTFYESRWVRPQSLSSPVAYVGVAITVTRSGALKDFQILEPSGIREMDASVRTVLGKYRSLAPLPSDTNDTERTFRIRFKLEGVPSA